MFQRVFIGIGSNVGDRRAYYHKALTQIAALPKVRLVKTSSLYETEPHGEAKTWYVNGVIEIETEFTPLDLLQCLQKIELDIGRKRAPEIKKWAARKIDLDLLLFDNQTIESNALTVPHPELHKRRFVLLPLAELAPHLTHPRFGVTIVELLAAVKDDKRVLLLPPNG
jgi:2-amino-4-hydroxy-6-hydroxymethyldihydropteridine diphosphokinase